MCWLFSYFLALCLRARPASIYIKIFEVPWEQLCFSSETTCCSSPCQCYIASSQPCQLTHCWGQQWRRWPASPTCLLGHPATSAHHLSCFLISILQTGPSSTSPATPAHLSVCPFLFGIIFFLSPPHCCVEMTYFLSSHVPFIVIFSVVSQIPLKTFRFPWILCSQLYSSPPHITSPFLPSYQYIPDSPLHSVAHDFPVYYIHECSAQGCEEETDEVESPKTFVHGYKCHCKSKVWEARLLKNDH